MKQLFIVGLRNYSKEYTGTRHNIAELCLNEYAKRAGVSWQRNVNNYDIACITPNAYLVLPRTYMNTSGKPISKFITRATAVDSLIAVHDELEVKLGQVKIKIGGSARGHNGLKSIINHLGGVDGFSRVMVGIGRPQSREPAAVADYVLSKFSREEYDLLNHGIDQACNMIQELVINASKS